MNRRRGWVPLVLGLVLAVGTGLAIFFLLQQQRETAAAQAEAMIAQEAAPVATMKVPVASRPLIPGTTLVSEDILLKDFPLELVPVSAITDTEMLESQVLAVPIGQGETFNLTQLMGESATRVSRKLPAGQVLFAYAISDLLTQSNVVEDGDHIDLLITLPVDAGPVTSFTLQNITVFQVLRAPGDSETEVGAATALLLSVAPEDAVMLKHIQDSEGIINFVLRSVLDTEPFDVPAVDREDLITRYQMR